MVSNTRSFRKKEIIMKTIAFSILNRNGLDDTISCINSLLASEFQDFDIFLLDNGSSDPKEYITLEKEYHQYKNIIIHQSNSNL
jgi:GT2 family glycosyltransferase